MCVALLNLLTHFVFLLFINLVHLVLCRSFFVCFSLYICLWELRLMLASSVVCLFVRFVCWLVFHWSLLFKKTNFGCLTIFPFFFHCSKAFSCRDRGQGQELEGKWMSAQNSSFLPSTKSWAFFNVCYPFTVVDCFACLCLCERKEGTCMPVYLAVLSKANR